jgi:hypothetical protein
VGIYEKDLKESYLHANFSETERRHALNDLDKTQSMVVSGLVVMWDYLKSLEADFSDGSPRNPEFALFDCVACHQELGAKSKASRRLIRTHLPGRPPLQSWQTTLARAGIWQASTDEKEREFSLKEFDKRWHAVEQAATQRPFGDGTAISKAAGDLVNWLQPRIVKISTQQFDKEAAARTWEFLTDASKVSKLDYYAARQTAWALEAIANDSGHGNAAHELFHPMGNDPLKLKLPAGQREKVLEELKSSLDAISGFDPVWFESVLGELHAK